MNSFNELGPSPGEPKQRQRGQAGAWPACVDGYRWIGGGEDAQLVAVSQDAKLVMIPRQRTALVREFAHLASGSRSQSEFGTRVIGFASRYGSLDPVRGPETLREWKNRSEGCSCLVRLIESVSWLEHVGSRRAEVQAALSWDDEGQLRLLDGWTMSLVHPEWAGDTPGALNRARSQGLSTLSDPQLARLARAAVAAYLTDELRERISVSLVGCDASDVYRPRPLGVRYVATGLLAGVYHVLALELLGRRAIEKRCEECGEVLESVRVDARFHRKCVVRRYRRTRAAKPAPEEV